MVERKVIIVDEEKCDGCGACIPNCPEGALKIVDGKLHVTEGLCDGLGACVGTCPKGALQVIEREAEDFDLTAAVSLIKELEKVDVEKAREHLEHLEKGGFNVGEALKQLEKQEGKSALSQWPVKLELISSTAPFLKGSELLVIADCVPFAYRNFHQNFLEGRKIVTGCPKFGNIKLYLQKLVEILKSSGIKELEVVRMEVPCCSGLKRIVEEAVKLTGVDAQVKEAIIGLVGERLAAPRGVECCH